MNFVNDQDYFAPFKKHEYILNNKSDSFEHKIESLIDVWKSIGELNLSQFDLRHVIQIMDWAKLHALNIVLTAEWDRFKETYQSKLLEEIEKAQNELLKLNSAFATRCKKLADVVRNPWEDPVLRNLMKTKDAEIGVEEIEFFCVETAYLVSVRLKKLCESHCEDLALNLVTAFMNCNKLSKTKNFSLNATETQMWFIFDIYIALLYKFQDKHKIVVLLKELTFGEGLQLVNRFAKKRVKISKIWKNCHRVAILAVQMYISQAVVKYTEELKDFLENYLEVYISLCNSDALLQDFSSSIRRISNLADAAGLYVFCAVIEKRAGQKLKPFVIEMYIRALTTDMNELERQKDANEVDKVTAITSRLAAAFCNLANFLSEHVKVARECVLTAFSLEPTKERLSNIEMLAKSSGFEVLDTGQEWKCKLHPPVLPSDEITWMCPECGEWMSKPEFNVPIKINMALNEALQNSILGISEALCDDLVVCLSNPRYQILSWFMPWEELHRLCLMYLQDPQATKNIVTELKFIDIDYSIFKGIKREPLDELDGIERGYEQYLDQDFVSDEETSSNSEDSMSQDSRPYSLGSDGAGEGPYLPMLPTQTKSDPNTLKSLRMFRPNLKRTREKETCPETPEKIFKADPNIPNIATTVTNSVDSSNVENTSASLNDHKNNVAPKFSAIQYPKPIPMSIDADITTNVTKSCDSDVSSKNVKTATLPLLGGQVAKKENTLIQVNNLSQQQQQKNLFPLLKSALMIKKCQLTKIDNSCMNGLKESKNCSKLTDHKAQDFRLPSPDLKVHNNPMSSAKNLKFLLIPKYLISEYRQSHPTINKDNSKDVIQEHLVQEQQQPQQSKPNLLVPERQLVLQPIKNNLQHQSPAALSQSQPLFKTLILSKLASNQKLPQKELRSQPTLCHNQEQTEILQASLPPQIPKSPLELLTNPSNTLINSQEPASSSPVPPNQQTQTKMIKLEKSLPSLIPLSNLIIPSSNQQSIPLIKIDNLQPNLEQDLKMSHKQDQKQTKNNCTSSQVANPANHNSSLNSSYQCLNPILLNQNQIQQQEAPSNPHQDTLNNLLIQIPHLKQRSNKNETPVRKQSENCSNLVVLHKEQLPEQSPQQIPPVKQEQPILLNSLIHQKFQSAALLYIPKSNLLLPLLKSNSSRLQPSPHPQPITPQLKSIPKLNDSSKGPTAVKLNSQTFQEQVALNPKNQTTQMSAHSTFSTTQTSNQIRMPHNTNKILQLPTAPQPNQVHRVSILKFNFQPPQSPKLDREICQIPVISKSNGTLRTPTPPNTNISQSPCTKLVTNLENPQISCPLPPINSQKLDQVKDIQKETINSMPLLNLSPHQNTSENHQPQSSQFTSQHVQSSIQQEQQLTLNEQQSHSSSLPQTVQNQNQNKDENKQVNPLTNKSLLHNNCYNLLKVPNHCLSSEKLPISQVNLQVTILNTEEHMAQVDPKKRIIIHQHLKISMCPPPNLTNMEINSALLEKEPVLVNPDNQPVKTKQEIQQKSNKISRFSKISQIEKKKNLRQVYQTQKNSYNSLDTILNKNYNDNKADVSKTLNDDLKCNNDDDSISRVNVNSTKDNSNNENNNDDFVKNRNSGTTAQFNSNGIDCSVTESSIFSDCFERYQAESLCNTRNCSALEKKEFQENDDPHELLPKINLTENIRTYTKKSKRKILVETEDCVKYTKKAKRKIVETKDCVKTPTGVDVLNDCKNVYNENSTENLHSTVQNSLTNSNELPLILCHLPSNKKIGGKCVGNKEDSIIKQKCDRGKNPPKNSRKRKNFDKSENKVGKAPNLVQNHILSPLQDVNLRVNSQMNTKVCCDFNKEEIKTDRGFPDKFPEKRSVLKSVLYNIPGLHDFQMIRPSDVNPVVNVVQVSGGRSTQSVSIQNSQTSTQVTPHIQRIGQPRVNDQKPEHSNSVTSTTQTPTTTSATSRTTTSQPSTLINILSQQIVRPVSNQTNTVRRQGPLINILSQQVIRPPKTAVNSITPTTEAIQVQNRFKWYLNAIGHKMTFLMKTCLVFLSA